MWANAKRDGCLPNIGDTFCKISVIPFLVPRRKDWLTPAAGVPSSNAANIRERKTWTWSEFCTRQNSVKGQEPPKMYVQCSRPGDGQTSCKVWLASGERCHCSNEGKTRNPLKFAGVPQNCQQISAVNRPKFSILQGDVEHILLFNKFFFRLSIRALVAKTQHNKLVRWCADGDFLRHFCVLYF